MMQFITAKEARTLTDKVLSPISGSIEFLAIMAKIDRDIRIAIDDGLEQIEVKAYTLPAYNDYKYPSGVNSKKISRTFWWPYVEEELKKLGYNINRTTIADTYIVSW